MLRDHLSIAITPCGLVHGSGALVDPGLHLRIRSGLAAYQAFQATLAIRGQASLSAVALTWAALEPDASASFVPDGPVSSLAEDPRWDLGRVDTFEQLLEMARHSVATGKGLTSVAWTPEER